MGAKVKKIRCRIFGHCTRWLLGEYDVLVICSRCSAQWLEPLE